MLYMNPLTGEPGLNISLTRNRLPYIFIYSLGVKRETGKDGSKKVAYRNVKLI